VERTRERRDTQAFLYGLSYGTSLAWRYLELFPHQAAGVIQDSVVSPGALFISRADTYFDPVLRDYAALCAADATCGARMGGDPYARLQALHAKLDAGHCPAAGWDRARLRYSLAGLLLNWRLRVLALPLAYRLERCAPQDVAALSRFASLYLAPLELGDTFSFPLESNISFSELWERPAPSAAELRAWDAGAVASLGWAAERAEAFALWPRYPESRWEVSWPKVKVPLLMLNGTLDAMTPLAGALEAAGRYTGPQQHFVTLPHVPHGALYNTPTTRPGAPQCAVLLVAGFVADSSAPPDTTCVAELQPLPFEDARTARSFFGTTSVWD
jgi:pimeloyl-ACP methyl ester carboxylesterase